MTNIKIYTAMTRKIIFMFVLFFCFLHFQLFCQVIDWEQTFGGEGTDIGLCVQPAIDGGYITCGWTTSFEENSDIYLIKTDDQGNEIWSNTIGGSGYESAKIIIQTTDSCYVLVGSTTSFGSGNYDVYLIKLDEDGNEIWTQCYGGIADDRGYCVQQTSDGGYIIVGHTESFGSGYWDIYLIKTDENGNEIWSNTFGGSDAEYGYFVRQTNDGGFIITGYTTSFGAGSKDVYLIKTDHLGNEIWSKTFGGSHADLGSSVLQTSDGGYIIAGYMSPNVESHFFLLKTDENGNEIWSHTFGGNYCWSMNQTSDSGFILCGKKYLGNFDMDIFVVKTDENGNEIWSQVYGGPGYDSGCYIIESPDGGYIMAGTYDFYLYLLKLLPENVSIEETEFIGGSASLFLKPAYPNPFNSEITISFSLNTENTEDTELIIYNIKGQKIRTFKIPQSEIKNPNCVVWNGTDENNHPVSSGVYFYRLKVNDKIVDTKKCLLLK